MKLVKIGLIKKNKKKTKAIIYEKYQEGLLGITQFSHIVICYWLNKNDTKKARKILKVHPCANPKNPITGVFATRSPNRPNPLAISVCKLISFENNYLNIEDIDALNNSPIIDIKGYFLDKLDKNSITVPKWSCSQT